MTPHFVVFWAMDPIDQLREALVLLFEDWLGREPAERLRRIQAIPHVSDKGLPLVMMMAEDEVLEIEVHRMPAKFLGPLEWQPTSLGQSPPVPGLIALVRLKNGPR